MLHVFCGNDTVAVRTKAIAALEPFELQGIIPVRLEADQYEVGALVHLASGVSLFGEGLVCLLDTPSEHPDFLAEFTAAIPSLAASPHTFVLVETTPTPAYRKTLQASAASYTELKVDTEQKFSFALGDALLARDKKLLWVELVTQLRAGVAAEPLCGQLWSQLRAMRLAAITARAEEAGMKEFPYKKAKAALRKYSLEDLERLSTSLLDVYHDGHGENGDMAVGLEQWVLKV